MYSLIAVDGKKVKKETGVNKNVVKSIRHKKFANVLFMTKIVKHNMKRIQSKLHRIRAYDVCKTSLSLFDDKRYILHDDINISTYFHQGIRGQ